MKKRIKNCVCKEGPRYVEVETTGLFWKLLPIIGFIILVAIWTYLDFVVNRNEVFQGRTRGAEIAFWAILLFSWLNVSYKEFKQGHSAGCALRKPPYKVILWASKI